LEVILKDITYFFHTKDMLKNQHKKTPE